MAADAAAFEARAAELRAAELGGRPSKQARNRLRLKHAEFLAKFTLQALAELPREPRESGEPERIEQLLRCACEAAMFMVHLGAFKSPETEKLCYNVSARCLALHRYVQAVDLAQVVIRAVRREDERAAASTPLKPSSRANIATPTAKPALLAAKTPAKAWSTALVANDDGLAPAGDESLGACELALTAACVWIRALEAQTSQRDGSDGEMLRAAMAVCSWLEHWRCLCASSDKEKGVADVDSSTGARAATQLANSVRVLRRRGMATIELEECESRAVKLATAPLPLVGTAPQPSPRCCNDGGVAARGQEEEAWRYVLEELRLAEAELRRGERSEGVGTRFVSRVEEAQEIAVERKARGERAGVKVSAALREIFVFYTNSMGSLAMRTLGKGGGQSGGQASSSTILPVRVAAALCRCLRVYAETIREMSEADLKRQDRQAYALAGVLIGAGKLDFHSEAASDATDCESLESNGSDWIDRIAATLREAATVVCVGVSAVPSTWPPPPAQDADALAWIMRLTRAAQQMAARLYNASQPRRAAYLAAAAADFASLATQPLEKSDADGAAALAGWVAALHMATHCYLQMKPSESLAALGHASAALRVRAALEDCGSVERPVDVPSLSELVALHVSIRCQLESAGGAKMRGKERARAHVIEDGALAFVLDERVSLSSGKALVFKAGPGLVEAVLEAELQAIARQLARYPTMSDKLLKGGLAMAALALEHITDGAAFARLRVMVARAELRHAAAAAARRASREKSVETKESGTEAAGDEEMAAAACDASDVLAALEVPCRSAGGWERMKVKELKNELQQRGLSVAGKREQLLERLRDTEGQADHFVCEEAHSLELRARALLVVAEAAMHRSRRNVELMRPGMDLGSEERCAAMAEELPTTAAERRTAADAVAEAASVWAAWAAHDETESSGVATHALLRCSRLLWQLLRETESLESAKLAASLARGGAVRGARGSDVRAAGAAVRWESELLLVAGRREEAIQAIDSAPEWVDMESVRCMAQLPPGRHSKLPNGGSACAELLSRAQEALLRGARPAALRRAQAALRSASRPVPGDDCERHMQCVACDALTFVGRLWARLGSLPDAQRHLASALDLARREGLVRCHLMTQLAVIELFTEADRLEDAARLHRAVAAELSAYSTASRFGGELQLQIDLALAKIALRRGANAEALEVAQRALERAEPPAPVTRALLLTTAAAAERIRGAADEAGNALQRAHELLDAVPSSPLDVARPRWLLERALLHVEAAEKAGELGGLWRWPGAPPLPRVTPGLSGARLALLEALQLGVSRSTPALWRSTCLIAAACCGLEQQAAGARLVAAAIGVGVREQMWLLSTAGVTDLQEEDNALNEAVAGLSLAEVGAGYKAKASRDAAWVHAMEDVGRGKGLVLSEDADSWIAEPPESCTVAAIALAPARLGLLVARWRTCSPPLLTLVPEREGGVEMALTELRAIMADDAPDHGSEMSGDSSAIEAADDRSGADTRRDGLGDEASTRANQESVKLPRRQRSATAATGEAAEPLREPVVERVELVGSVMKGSAAQTICLSRARRKVVIGRAQRGTCRVNHPQVSSSHCTIAFDPISGCVLLTDTSTNGTFVDGVRPSKKDIKLHDGQAVSLLPADVSAPEVPSFVVRFVQGSLAAPPARAPSDSGRSEWSSLPASEGSSSIVEAPSSSEPSMSGALAPPKEEHRERSSFGRNLGMGSCEWHKGLTSAFAPRAASEVGQAFNDRLAFWTRRAALDHRMSQLSTRLESSILQHGLTLAFPAACSTAPVEELLARRALEANWSIDSEWVKAIRDAAAALDVNALAHALSAALGPNRGAALSSESLLVLAEEIRELANDESRSKPGALMLLLDEPLQSLPWECIPALRDAPVCRLPCPGFVGRCATAAKARGGVSLDSAFYVLNPSGDLHRTQLALQERIAQPPREGVVGEPPDPGVLQDALKQKDVYIYCGHGDGRRYLPAELLQRLPRCPVAVLMGCSSGLIRSHGGLGPSGTALQYLHASCPALVANLWDVTDGEIDRFTAALFDQCTCSNTDSAIELLAAVSAARKACRLPFLTGGAAVVYGAPLSFR